MDRWTREDVAGIAGILIAAGLLTFGNILVEALMLALGL